MLQAGVPLCSAQYRRLFNTTRVPGEDVDTLVHCPTSHCRHIVVHCKGPPCPPSPFPGARVGSWPAGSWYKLVIHTGLRLLEPAELQLGLEAILAAAAAAKPPPAEASVAALTAGGRKRWAAARAAFFKDGPNRDSLAAIEGAAFVLCLDDEDFRVDKVDSCKFSPCR